MKTRLQSLATMMVYTAVLASIATPALAAAAEEKTPAAPKVEVELLCEGKLRVYSLLPDNTERESGRERSHDLNLKVIDQRSFRTFDDDGSAIQLRFDDEKWCLTRSDGAACMRATPASDGGSMSTKDLLDINRFTGRITVNHLRTFTSPVKYGDNTVIGARLEYAGKCRRPDSPADAKPEESAKPATRAGGTDSKP